MREFERAQRALARRHHQLVLVLGHGERERRSDMRHRVATGIGFGPARIVHQIGLENLEPLSGSRFSRPI